MIFKDTITAYHKTKVTNEDGSTSEQKADKPFIQNACCQISHAENDKASPKAKDRIPQDKTIKIFVWMKDMPHGEEFKRGDFIAVHRTDTAGVIRESYSGEIGDPNIFTRGIPHVEFSLEAQS